MASELTQKRAPKWCLAQLDVTEKQRVGICLNLFLTYSCDSVKLIFSVQ